MTGERTFTVEEANAALPDLRRRLSRIRAARQTILRFGRRVRGTATRDGGGPEGREYREAVATLREETEHLARSGFILRDAEEGLVDFPAVREGRPVFLCWRLGEDRVRYWHEADTGFAGRTPL